ncbi:hypothetical protein [Streptomyces virginiae]|uniref:hypothetical protein n=1 Tax=Streptomyces virginiae TaxID=1961 RepID=UPI0038652175|nr:hypothetical protein OG253_35285 [Streptomyces virginiae]
MIIIEDLFTSQSYCQAPEPIEWDPLKEPDALHDTQLLDFRVSPTSNRAALLFDMRTASNYLAGNSALLVVRGLKSISWNAAPQRRELMAFSVMSSRPSVASDGGLLLELQLFPDGRHSMLGTRMEFYLLDSQGIPEAPPNYIGRTIRQVGNELPSWNSSCVVLQSVATEVE